MNIRRGFFRLWVVATALYIAGVSVFYFFNIRNMEATYGTPQAAVGRLPTDCEAQRGVEGADFIRVTDTGKPWDRYLCWYTLPDIRRLYPEYAGIGDDQLTRQLFVTANRSYGYYGYWPTIQVAALIGLVPPLLALVVGSAIGWALSGFRGGRRPA